MEILYCALTLTTLSRSCGHKARIAKYSHIADHFAIYTIHTNKHVAMYEFCIFAEKSRVSVSILNQFINYK